MVQQADYDDQYFLCSIATARRLLGDSLLTTAYEVKLTSGANAELVKKNILQQIAQYSNTSSPSASDSLRSETSRPAFRILTRNEQQADAYRIMQIEKWITYLLIIFILLVASFNIIGALSMLMIDKSAEITTLRNLGASDRLIRQIFTLEGWLISGSGAFFGALLGIVLCLLQQNFEIIKLGTGVSANYVVSAYPVHLIWSDVLLTFVSVAVIGWLATAYTTRSQKL